jgi:membrane protease YdiL (CAAX protease family)
VLFFLKRQAVLEILGMVGLFLAAWVGIEVDYFEVEFAPTAYAIGYGVLGFAALAVGALVLDRLYFVVRGRERTGPLRAALATLYSRASPLQVALIGIGAAAEEAFFRGFVQNQFGLVIASVVFALAHLGAKQWWPLTLGTLLQGFALGALYSYSGSLMAPIIAHGIFDIAAMAYFRTPAPASSES